MQASRLLAIMIRLQVNGRLSARALAREFEVSVRTIYRDVDQLSAAGIPIYAERGRDGGFALDGAYRTSLTGFTPDEARAMMLGGLGAASVDLGLGPELAMSQRKLLASLSPDQARQAQQVADCFHLDPYPWYRSPSAVGLLPDLARALWQGRAVKVAYTSWKGHSQQTLGPLGLVLKAGVWYLLAQRIDAKKAPRIGIWRVSAIASLQVLDTLFGRPADFDLAQAWAAQLARFDAQRLTQTAHLAVRRDALNWLAEINQAAAEELQANGQPGPACGWPDGWLVGHVRIESVELARRQFLALGPLLEVIGPPDLRAAMAQAASQLSALYAGAADPPRAS